MFNRVTGCRWVAGILQAASGGIQSRRRVCVRVALLGQVQVLQEDQDVDDAAELGAFRPQRRASARRTCRIHVRAQTGGEAAGAAGAGGEQGVRRRRGEGEDRTEEEEEAGTR